jgi:hypothetical protein
MLSGAEFAYCCSCAMAVGVCVKAAMPARLDMGMLQWMAKCSSVDWE